MGYFWSPSFKGFYCQEVHGESMPFDVVSVSDEQYQSLLQHQASGCVIRVAESGQPEAIHPDDMLMSADAVAAAFTARVQREIEGLATAWGYDSVLSSASYAMSAIPRFRAESLALLAYRDAMWAWAGAQTNPGELTRGEFAAMIDDVMADAPAKPARPWE